MGEYDDSILGQVQVCLQGVCSDLDSAPKCSHGIFGMLIFVASVRDCLG